MLEQHKVDALRGALQTLIRDHAHSEHTEDNVWLHLKDADIMAFVENLEGIIGKENKP